MNIYSKKQRWKLILVAAAMIIGVVSLWYTNVLVENLSQEERKKVKHWAEAQKILATINPDQEVALSFALEVVIDNEMVPVIVVDANDSILFDKNLDSLKSEDYAYKLKRLKEMKSENEPIEIAVTDELTQYIYYSNSTLLKRLYYYPYIQIAVFFLFIVVAYFAFSSSRKAEQNQVWVGMSKETAHQLGTPISSMLAWIELLKMKNADQELLTEIEKDMGRLETITDRFSKIGSTPVVKKENICSVLNEAVLYIKSRSSEKISFNLHFHKGDELFAPLNISLFEWVIENVCKNAIDAMNGQGSIDIYLTDQTQVMYIDIKDTGKGVHKSKYKTIFHPGFTTKERGWGLGLSLAKRIIEAYHSGKIFVKNSEINKGTTIRIALKK